VKAILVTLLIASACSTEEWQAEKAPYCPAGGWMRASGDRMNEIVEVTLDGPDCPVETVSCGVSLVEPRFGCNYGSPSAPGACTLTVTFNTGEPPFVTTVDFKRPTESRCYGFHVDPYFIMLPSRDAAAYPTRDGGVFLTTDAGADAALADADVTD
jgi:hypothetical protein